MTDKLNNDFPQDIGYKHDYSKLGPPDPVGKWLRHDWEMKHRSLKERGRRENGTRILTLGNLQSEFNQFIDSTQAQHAGKVTSDSAVMGIMESADDLFRFETEGLLIFRKFAGLPDEPSETQNLWDLMYHFDLDGNDQTRSLVRKDGREGFWRGLNKSIEESKRKFGIRQLSGDDVSDLCKGITKGSGSFLSRVKGIDFTLELQKRGMLNAEKSGLIIEINKEMEKRISTYQFSPKDVIDEKKVLQTSEIYDGVLFGNCKTPEDCIVYDRDRFFPGDRGRTILRAVIHRHPVSNRFPPFDDEKTLYYRAEHDDPDIVEDL